MSYFYNTVTTAIITYDQLKVLYPMFSWPKFDNGASVDARLLMDDIHPDILQYKRLYDLEVPLKTRYEVIERANPIYNVDRWEWGWNIRAMTTEEREEVDVALREEIKAYRDADWSNAQITLSNGAVFQINERTRRDVQDTLTGLITIGIDEYSGWNAVNGIYDMTVSLFQEAIVKALQRVKKSFDAYNFVIEKHSIDPYQAQEWEEDFNTQVGG